MKRIISLILFICLCVLSFAQTENIKWSEKEGRYSNYDYGFFWSVDPEYGFKLMPTQTKHTVFRAEALDGLVIIFVNIQDLGATVDAWEKFETVKLLGEQSFEKNYQLTGERTTKSIFNKVVLSGQHAVKVVYWSRLEGEGFPEPLKFVSTTYKLYKEDYSWSVSIKVIEEMYDESIIQDIIRGFRFIPK